MTPKQASTILRAHNRWRRGGGNMLPPRDIGEAIDVTLRIMAEHEPAMDTLRMIASNKRRTREQRMAHACVTFLDALADAKTMVARRPKKRAGGAS